MKVIRFNLAELRRHLSTIPDIQANTGDLALKAYAALCLTRLQHTLNGLEPLLVSLEQNAAIDYSAGLLIRPMLGDVLSLEYLASYIDVHRNDTDLDAFVDKFCKGYLYDGTYKWIEQFKMDEEKGVLDVEKKALLIGGLRKQFPELFVEKTPEKWEYNNPYKALQAKELYKSIDVQKMDKDKAIVMSKIYYLYNYYSKFEHLSTWTHTLLTTQYIGRIQQIEETSFHMLRHLQTILTFLKLYEPSFDSIQQAVGKSIEVGFNMVPDRH
ncbi:hypothetical protein GO495_05990 [Chitinophaga oryziterrae]|uniref:Uncharacterized protein n=1 Tax=Chitinophaga oryziterrae TaxID=1031224 RepID=A0A6N8J4E9_9BACT|nr:hypothetical protein [Chitinophaga oryziterrae]MVT40125.1 hypothetical protein [Chitinophaga oryziterrae]